MDQRLKAPILFEFFGLVLLIQSIVLIIWYLWIAYVQPLWGNPPLAVSIERVGILFQFLAGFSVITEYFGEERLLAKGSRLRQLEKSIKIIRFKERWNNLFKPSAESSLWLTTLALVFRYDRVLPFDSNGST